MRIATPHGESEIVAHQGHDFPSLDGDQELMRAGRINLMLTSEREEMSFVIVTYRAIWIRDYEPIVVLAVCMDRQATHDYRICLGGRSPHPFDGWSIHFLGDDIWTHRIPCGKHFRENDQVGLTCNSFN
jgi:hypothetical protein